MELCVHPSQAPVLDATTTCTFLDVVPLEIREMIYRYVLVVKTEHNMNSLEVRLYRLASLVLADSLLSIAKIGTRY